jgi:hypothetical protein
MHLASAEEVDVEVVDRLSALGAGADDDSIAFAEALFARDCGSGEQEAAEQWLVGGLRFGQRCQVLFRDHQNVGGGLRLDVMEGENRVVFKDLFRGNAARDDFAEDAVRVQVSPLCCPPGRGC